MSKNGVRDSWGPLRIAISEETKKAWRRLRPIPGAKFAPKDSPRSAPKPERKETSNG